MLERRIDQLLAVRRMGLERASCRKEVQERSVREKRVKIFWKVSSKVAATHPLEPKYESVSPKAEQY